MHIHEALVCVWICSFWRKKNNIFLISCKHTKMEKHMVTPSLLICFYWQCLSSHVCTELVWRLRHYCVEKRLTYMRVNTRPSVSLFKVSWNLLCISEPLLFSHSCSCVVYLIFWSMFVLSVYDYGWCSDNDAHLCVDPCLEFWSCLDVPL